jgi:hypothetical protein
MGRREEEEGGGRERVEVGFGDRKRPILWTTSPLSH